MVMGCVFSDYWMSMMPYHVLCCTAPKICRTRGGGHNGKFSIIGYTIQHLKRADSGRILGRLCIDPFLIIIML